MPDTPALLRDAASTLRRLLAITLAVDPSTLPPAVRAAREAAERAAPELRMARKTADADGDDAGREIRPDCT